MRMAGISRPAAALPTDLYCGTGGFGLVGFGTFPGFGRVVGFGIGFGCGTLRFGVAMRHLLSLLKRAARINWL